jgi:hypothetical protein
LQRISDNEINECLQKYKKGGGTGKPSRTTRKAEAIGKINNSDKNCRKNNLEKEKNHGY